MFYENEGLSVMRRLQTGTETHFLTFQWTLRSYAVPAKLTFASQPTVHYCWMELVGLTSKILTMISSTGKHVITTAKGEALI